MRDACAVLDQRHDFAIARVARIAREFSATKFVGDIEPDIGGGGIARALPRGARRCLLPCHRRVKSETVDADAPRTQCVLSEVVGEAIGVIELECGFARQRIATRQRRGCFVEQAEPVTQGLTEAGFLLQQRCLDQRLRANKLRERRTHFRNKAGH